MHLVSDDQPGPCGPGCSCQSAIEVFLPGDPAEQTLAAGDRHQLSQFRADGETVYDVLTVSAGVTVGELIECLTALEPDAVVTAADTDPAEARVWMEFTPGRHVTHLHPIVMVIALLVLLCGVCRPMLIQAPSTANGKKRGVVVSVVADGSDRLALAA